jgi:hypothetical protein
MPAGDERHEDLVHHILLSDDSSPDFCPQPYRRVEQGIAPAGGGALADGQGGAQRTGRRRR